MPRPIFERSKDSQGALKKALNHPNSLWIRETHSGRESIATRGR
jgi:hypothetical protein